MFCFGGFGATWVGMTDSSRARLFADSPPAPSVAMCCISFWATTLLALEVRWTPSPAQMLAPSTIVRSCKGDSSRPKNPSIFRILASDVCSLAAAASVRHFSDPEISVKKFRIQPVGHMFGIAAAGGRDVPRKQYCEDDLCSPRLFNDFFHRFHTRLEGRGGGGANWRSPKRWYCPSSTDLAAGMGSPYLGNQSLTSGLLQLCLFQSGIAFSRYCTVFQSCQTWGPTL